MVDVNTESLLQVPTEAAKHIPGRPDASTVYRWWKRGIKGVRLETILIGGRRYTSKEALTRFFAATTAAADGPQAAVTPARRQREIEAAERELEAQGL